MTISQMKYLHELANRVLSGETASQILHGLTPQNKGHTGEALLRMFTLFGIHPTDGLFVIPYQAIPSSRRMESISSVSERLDILRTGRINAGGSNKIDVSWRDGIYICVCSSKIGVQDVASIAHLEIVPMLGEFTEGGGYTEHGIQVNRDSVVPYVLVDNKEDIFRLAERSKASNKATKDNLNGLNVLDKNDLDRMCAIFLERIQPGSTDFECILNHLMMETKSSLRTRLHQKMITTKTKRLLRFGNKIILIGALPRSGKTYIGADLAKDFKKVLIITTRPGETRSQWNKVFKEHREFSSYSVVDLNSHSSDEISSLNRKGENLIAIASIQFFKMDEREVLKGLEWDMVILDEIHEGGSTELSQSVIDTYLGSNSIRIMMTATYTKPVDYYHIPSECCCFWDLEDVRLMRSWGEPWVFDRLCEKHGVTDVEEAREACYKSGETDRSIQLCYTQAPTLGILTHMMNPTYYEALSSDAGHVYGFSMRSLFMPTSDGRAFQNQRNVDTFLSLLSGSDKMTHYKKGDMSMFARIRRYWKMIEHRENDEFMTQLWFLPFGTGQLVEDVKRNLISRIQANAVLKHFDTLTLDSGMGDINKIVSSAVVDAKAQGKKGILLLTGNVGSLGVSLPEVDIALLLHDFESADLNYQQMMRVLTEMMHKKCGIVIDYNLWRVLTTLNTYASHCGKSENSTSRIGWCLSHLIDVDPDLIQCKDSPESFSQENIIRELTSQWMKMLECMSTSLKRLARTKIDLDEDQSELDNIAKGRKETYGKITLSINPEQEKPCAGIDRRYADDDSDSEQEDAEKEKEKESLKANLNDVLARLIPEIAVLSGCKPELIEAMTAINRNRRQCVAMNEFLNSLYETTQNHSFSRLLRLVKCNQIKLTDAKETYEVIRNRMAVLDNPQELISFLGQHLTPKEFEKKNLGEVFTNPLLIQQEYDQLTKCDPTIWSDPSKKFMDPANGIGNYPALAYHRLMDGLQTVIPDKEERKKHILENMLFMCEINKKNIEVSRMVFDPDNRYALNLYEGSYFDLNPVQEWGIDKFDMIFGNPPFQDNTKNKGKGHRLWVPFVSKSLLLLKKDGFLVFVHPAGWRQPGNELLDVMKTKQIHYLSIQDEKEGLKMFKCNTRYDWYVLQNTPCYKETRIMTQDGKAYDILLSTMSFIPNSMFHEIQSWTSGDSKLQVIKQRSAYGHDKKHMSSKKSETHLYPAVYSVNRKNVPTLHYSSLNTNGHYDIPKVIFGSGATGFISDPTGQYAMTQWCTAIVDSPDKHAHIIEVLDHPRFKQVIHACSVGKAEINAEILRFFRKDFFDTFVLDTVAVEVAFAVPSDYDSMTVAELKQQCKDKSLKGLSGKSKKELISMLTCPI